MLKLWKLLWYGGAEPDDYKRIEGNIWKSNRKNVLVFTIALLLVLATMCIISQRSDYYNNIYKIFYAGDAILAAVIVFLLAFLPERKLFILPCVDLFMILAFGSSIFLSCFVSPDSPAVNYMVFLVILPQLVGGRPLSMILRNTIAMASYIYFCLVYCPTDILYAEIMNTLIYGLLSIVLSIFTMRANVNRYVNEYKLQYLGDIDLLTGVNNRNMFERCLKRYPRISKEQLNCVYIDVNGLHEMNNTQGHEIGDDALRHVAEELKHNFRQSDIYRIGGDEFVVFVSDAPYLSVVERMDRCRIDLLDLNIFISYGVKNMSKDKLDIDILIKEAEKKMFQAKEEFYTSRGMIHR